MQIATIEFTLPSYWACYLINGDNSYLEDDETLEIDQWLADQDHNLHCIDVSEDSEFTIDNDANNLGGDTSTFTFQLLNDDGSVILESEL